MFYDHILQFIISDLVTHREFLKFRVNNTYNDNMSQQNFSIAYFSAKHKIPILPILTVTLFSVFLMKTSKEAIAGRVRL